jgi:hypothetical protein
MRAITTAFVLALAGGCGLDPLLESCLYDCEQTYACWEAWGWDTSGVCGTVDEHLCFGVVSGEAARESCANYCADYREEHGQRARQIAAYEECRDHAGCQWQACARAP